MRYIYLALASIAGALLFLLIFAEAGDAQVKQTRAQLAAERDMYADMLIDDEIQIGQLKKDLQSRDDTIQMLMDSYSTQQKRLDALEYANKCYWLFTRPPRYEIPRYIVRAMRFRCGAGLPLQAKIATNESNRVQTGTPH
jgi:hypothetical protein